MLDLSRKFGEISYMSFQRFERSKDDKTFWQCECLLLLGGSYYWRKMPEFLRINGINCFSHLYGA